MNQANYWRYSPNKKKKNENNNYLEILEAQIIMLFSKIVLRRLKDLGQIVLQLT